MKKSIFIIFLSIGFQPLAEAGTLSDSLYEVFLLHPNIRYSYAYTYYGISGDEMTSASMKDSGQVDYVVLDSVNTNDSTITWHILEIRNFWRNSRNQTHIINDTTYLVNDSVNLTLYEDKRGNHELKCSGLIWRFPLLQLRGEIRQTVYRYWNTSEPLFDWQWNNASHNGVNGTGADTIILSKDFGFRHRHLKENWTSGYMWGNSTKTINILHTPTGVSTNRNDFPNAIFLEQNYPNPFNPTTTIPFSLPSRRYVTLKIFDLIGREVVTLVSEELPAGNHSRQWNAAHMPSGIYFYRLQANGYLETKKLVLLK